jgi:hypothetical protein
MAQEDLKRKLAAILKAGLVGYGRSNNGRMVSRIISAKRNNP